MRVRGICYARKVLRTFGARLANAPASDGNPGNGRTRMKVRLKPVGEQVIVITGADSGIGLATARLAVKRGAAVMLNSRNGEALERIADEMAASGARVEWYAGDVADEHAMHTL